MSNVIIEAIKQNKIPKDYKSFVRKNIGSVGYVDSFNNTALMFACKDSNMTQLALELISTGQSKPDQVNNNGNTALIYACEYDMTKVALALIQTGNSNLSHVNKDGNTALILACNINSTKVALALIKTGQSKPDIVNNRSNTALILACFNKNSKVALALIKTGQSNPDHVNDHGYKALTVAIRNNMIDIIHLLEPNKQQKLLERQKAINERVKQAAQQHVEIDTPYEECIICGELLDNTNGPNESEKCTENCNDVVKICENNHMIHRGCILNACNADRVDVAAQIGFSQFSRLAEQKRKNLCPICQMPLLVSCEAFKTVDKVLETDLPKKAVGGKRNKKTKRRYNRNYKKTKRQYKKNNKKTKRRY
jgi:hypothetical protein